MEPTKEMPSIKNKLFEQIRTGCMDRIDAVTIPFFGIQDEKLIQDRTGVLYRTGNLHFVLTAAHHLYEFMELGIPLFLDHSGLHETPIPVEGSDVVSTESDGVARDVAAFLLPENAVAELKKTKQFLTHSEISMRNDTPNSLFLLHGYPVKWHEHEEGAVYRPKALTYTTKQYAGETSPELFDPAIHMALSFEGMAVMTHDGSERELPNPKGMSGCGVWQLCELTNEGVARFRPEKVSLVGIEHRWNEERGYLVATRIEYILELIAQKYPEQSGGMNIAYPR